MKLLLHLILVLFAPFLLSAQTTYTWNGATSNWTVTTNWTPTRTAPATNDILVFNGSATTFNITGVPTETEGSILVTGSSTYTFTPTGTQTLTLSSTTGNTFQIDNGSTLSIGASGNALNITLPAVATTSIGGQLNLVNGNLGINNGTLILRDNPSPLARTGGQVSMGASAVLQFGANGSSETTATIVLPNTIFVGSINIASIVLNRTNGAQLSDQAITLSSGVTFTLGNLTVPNSGTLIFGNAASDPVLTESLTSNIVGYAEMQSRVITTGAIDFLGFSMAAGADNLNNIIIKRQTGTPVTFNTVPSIAAVWNVVTGFQPTSGRNINFKWLSTFDGVYTTVTNPFKTYVNDGSPGWTFIGGTDNLSSTATLRVSHTEPTTQFGFDFTLTDNTVTLPVELLYFAASAKQSSIQLNWATASEKNFDYFIIQGSTNGKNFKELGRVQGSGTSNTEHVYSFVDKNPMIGISYYKLVEVDFDNIVTNLGIVSATLNEAKEFSIFPNPVVQGTDLNFQSNFDLGPSTKVSISDVTGRLISEFTVNDSETKFSVSLTPGMYIVNLNSSAIHSVNRLIVK